MHPFDLVVSGRDVDGVVEDVHPAMGENVYEEIKDGPARDDDAHIDRHHDGLRLEQRRRRPRRPPGAGVQTQNAGPGESSRTERRRYTARTNADGESAVPRLDVDHHRLDDIVKRSVVDVLDDSCSKSCA